MSAQPDLGVILLAAGVAGLLGWFFWYVIYSGARTMGMLSRYLDGRAERQRAEIEHERLHGRPPLWLRAARVAILAMLGGLLAFQLATKFQIR